MIAPEDHVPEIMLARMISMFESVIDFESLRFDYWNDLGHRAEAEDARANLLSALVEHERRVDAYERRFGEIPRMQFGTVDTRSAKHWSAGNPHYPPIPAIRARIRHDADGGEASRFADSERTSS